MKGNTARMLILGYGNPSRGDDGLGPAFAAAVGAQGLSGVSIDSDYHLHLEDAATLAEHEVVVFVDATVEGPAPFTFDRVRPDYSMGFTTHLIEPPALLGLARGLFYAETEGYVLGIRGYEFEAFREELSERARANLEAALGFLLPVLRRAPLRKVPVETEVDFRLSPSLAARSSYV